MAKVSRPIVYSVVAAAAIYAVVLLTEPEKPPRKAVKRNTTGAAAKAPAGFLAEDMTAKFDRYEAKSRNAFQPEVLPKQTVINALPPARGTGGDFAKLLGGSGLRGSWNLTGINTVDGRRSALIENGTSGDSIFLKVGDSWNGLQVVSIEADTVVFLNSLGQRTQLRFADPESEAAAAAEAAALKATGAVPGTPAAPGTSRTVITVTPINKNGITVTNGGVAPVVPALPAPPAATDSGFPQTRGRRQR